jgi:hypothetical protein
MGWTNKKDEKEGPRESKQERRQRKQQKKKEEECHRAVEETEAFNESSWEKAIAKALRKGNFGSMQRLFEKYLRHQAMGARDRPTGMRSLVIKSFRTLSTKYHPDKHASAGSDPTVYKVAFQALNEARAEVLRQLTD